MNTNQDWKFVKLARIHYFKEKTHASADSKSSMLSFEVSRTGIQITEITSTSKNRNIQSFWFQTYHIFIKNFFIVYLKTNVTNVKHHELHSPTCPIWPKLVLSFLFNNWFIIVWLNHNIVAQVLLKKKAEEITQQI